MMRVGQGDIFLKRVRWVYEREFQAISEYIYYSVTLREEYPYIADLFDSLAIDEIEALQLLGNILYRESNDASIDFRVRKGRTVGEENIEKIIRFEVGEIKERIRECERILSYSTDPHRCEGISRVIEIKAEALESLDRMMRS